MDWQHYYVERALRKKRMPYRSLMLTSFLCSLFLQLLAHAALSFVLWFAGGLGAPWEELSTVWIRCALWPVPALSFAIALALNASDIGIFGNKSRMSCGRVLSGLTWLTLCGVSIIAIIGLFWPFSVMKRYQINDSIETATLVASIYDSAIKRAVLCEAEQDKLVVGCHLHSLIVYAPSGKDFRWLSEDNARRYKAACNPDWIVGVHDKPELIVIVTKKGETNTGRFIGGFGNMEDLGPSSEAEWEVKFVSLECNAIVKNVNIVEEDGITKMPWGDSIVHASSQPPDPDEVIDIIRKNITWLPSPAMEKR